jgi:hypothetical protein
LSWSALSGYSCHQLSWTDQQLDLLRPRWPRFDLWYVPHYLGPGCWCARPKGTATATINAYDLQDFIGQLEEQDEALVTAEALSPSPGSQRDSARTEQGK